MSNSLIIILTLFLITLLVCLPHNKEGYLLPIMEPSFNLRECAKQLILLEDHLNNPRKRCPDCIKKHCLAIEALAEEGASLDKKGMYREECNNLAEKLRGIESDLLSGRDPSEVAQLIRHIRKPLVQKYF